MSTLAWDVDYDGHLPGLNIWDWLCRQLGERVHGIVRAELDGDMLSVWTYASPLRTDPAGYIVREGPHTFPCGSPPPADVLALGQPVREGGKP